ncbi:MAG: hypothetical protein K2Y12_12770, partial [Chitinophagaceae bacterium]|nr:hypothetical protein [Chitinophagaceae bacterium]
MKIYKQPLLAFHDVLVLSFYRSGRWDSKRVFNIWSWEYFAKPWFDLTPALSKGEGVLISKK